MVEHKKYKNTSINSLNTYEADQLKAEMELMKKKKTKADLMEQMQEKHETSVNGINSEREIDFRRIKD